jgi:hypothetical protein
MGSFSLIHTGLDISSLSSELEDNSVMFGEFNARKDASGSPHSEMDDIWLRYGDISEMVESGDYSKIADEHDSIWLKDLPEAKKICFKVMAMVDGERLGGVLITRLPSGGKISPHTDSGWHAEYYNKYYVPIKNDDGAVFGFQDGEISPDIGDVWEFDNSILHWVNNNSGGDRIAMIICIKGGGICRGVSQ